MASPTIRKTRAKSTRPGARPAPRSRANRAPHWTAETAGDWHEWSIVERLGWWAIVIATVGVPTVFFSWGLNAFDVPKFALLWSCSSVALLGVIASVSTGRIAIARTKVGWAALAFVVTQVAATILSISPRLSLFGSYGRYMGLVPTLLFLSLAFAIVCYCATTPELVRHLVGAIAVATIAGALLAVAEPLGLDLGFNTGNNATGASVGLQGNSDFSAGALAIGFPSLIYLRARSTELWIRVVATVSMPLVILAMFLLNSRGALIAIAAGVVTAGWMNRELVPRVLTWIGTAALGVVVVALLLLGATRTGPMGDRFDHIPLLRGGTFVQRIDIWRGTASVIGDRPILGSGPDTLGITLPPHQPAELTTRPQQVDTAHDVFLQRGAESGLLGMLAYATLIGWVIVRGVRNRAAVSGSGGLLMCTSVAVLVAYVTQALFSIDELQIAAFGWIAAGMVLAVADPAARAVSGATEERERRPLPVGWSFGLTVAAFALVLLAALPVVADARFARASGFGSGLRRDPKLAKQMQTAIEEASALNPLEATYPAEGARYALDATSNMPADDRKRLLDWADAQLTKAYAVQPGHRELRIREARIADQRATLGDLSQFERSEDILRALEEEDPYDPKAKVERSYHLQTWRTATKREELVEEIRSEARAIEALPFLFPTGWCQVSLIYSRIEAHDDAVRTARKCAELVPGDPAAKKRLDDAERGS